VVVTDDMLWNGSEEDGDVRRECEEDEGIACEGEDNYTDWLEKTKSDILCVLIDISSKIYLIGRRLSFGVSS
jgi:hypothetical protein